MTRKNRTIKIGYAVVQTTPLEKREIWRVISVQNSTEHKPGEVLTERQVSALCHDRNWSVTTVPLTAEGAAFVIRESTR